MEVIVFFSSQRACGPREQPRRTSSDDVDRCTDKLALPANVEKKGEQRMHPGGCMGKEVGGEQTSHCDEYLHVTGEVATSIDSKRQEHT